MTGVAGVLLAAGSLVAAVAALVTALANGRGIRTVHEEVKTANGKTLAQLTDLTEGRRVRDEVPAEDRTASERHYVQHLEEDEDPTTT